MTDRNQVRDGWKAMWAETIDCHAVDVTCLDWQRLEDDLVGNSAVVDAAHYAIEDAQESLAEWVMGALSEVQAQVNLMLFSETEALDDAAATRVGKRCQPAMRDVCRTAGEIITRAGEQMVERSEDVEQDGSTVTFTFSARWRDAWEMPTVSPESPIWKGLEALRMTAREGANQEKIDAYLGARLDALWPVLRARMLAGGGVRALISASYWVDRFEEFANSVPAAPEGDSL